MYARVSGTTLEKFPYTLRDLKADNPQVSFTTATTLDDVAQYGVVAVSQEPDPVFDPATEKLVQGVPVLDLGTWKVRRVVELLSADEIAEYEFQQDEAAVKVDAEVLALLKARPDQINNYIENNVTDLDSAKTVLKILARAVSVLANRTLR